jgi:hypothetical protein
MVLFHCMCLWGDDLPHTRLPLPRAISGTKQWTTSPSIADSSVTRVNLETLEFTPLNIVYSDASSTDGCVFDMRVRACPPNTHCAMVRRVPWRWRVILPRTIRQQRLFVRHVYVTGVHHPPSALPMLSTNPTAGSAPVYRNGLMSAHPEHRPHARSAHPRRARG